MITETALPGRRDLLRGAAVLGFGSMLAACADLIPTDVGIALTPNPLTDPAVLNFALNLEYLEAEYYTRAVTGRGLEGAAMIGPQPGPVTGGRRVTFSDPVLAGFAAEIAADEQAHVRFLYAAARPSPLTEISRPAIDLQNSFRQVGQAAGLGADFDPFANEEAFLLGAFLFEDVGVSAYTGAASLIADKTILAAAAGIQATEAYHAGLIRSEIYTRHPRLRQAANNIAAARGRLSAGGTARNAAESPLADGNQAFISARDADGLTWARDPRDVLRVVFLNPANQVDKGGFFPAGVQGVVKAT